MARIDSIPVMAPDERRGSPPDGRSASPLTPEHLRAIQRARSGARGVRRAAGVAAFSGWSMAFFAVLTLAAGLLDWVYLISGALLLAIAINELRGGQRLRRFDPSGARVLGWNQVIFGMLILSYAGYRLTVGIPTGALGAASTGDPEMDRTIADLTRVITLAVYGAVGAFGVLLPGLTALYYFTRGRVVRRFVDGTPEWVIEALRA